MLLPIEGKYTSDHADCESDVCCITKEEKDWGNLLFLYYLNCLLYVIYSSLFFNYKRYTKFNTQACCGLHTYGRTSPNLVNMAIEINIKRGGGIEPGKIVLPSTTYYKKTARITVET